MASARTIVRRRSCYAFAAVIAAGAMAALVAIAGDQQVASLVFGQADFYKNAPNFVDGTGMAAPSAVAIDTSASPNHVWVADTANNRVLGWDDAGGFVSGAAADIVIGQPDFLSSAPNQGGAPGAGTLSAPAGVGVDRSGNLYVADSGNNRVTVFGAPLAGFNGTPIAGAVAAAVFGQGGNFQSSAGCASGQVSAATLCRPEGLALDSAGNLFVVDAGDNRVTVYFTPFSGGRVTQPISTAASLIFGQSVASGAACNQGSSATASTLCFDIGGAPFGSVGLALDGTGDLFVADTGNDRALEYTGPFGAKGRNSTAANLVFAGTEVVSEPSGIAVDGAGNLYIGWNQGDEILIYEKAVTLSNTTANLTIGLSEENPSSTSLSGPGGLAIDGAGNLYAADTGNNRVLEFNEGSSFPTASASGELGQPDFAHGAINRVDGAGLDAPGGVAIAVAGAQTAVYLADTKNNRVLGWIGPSAPASGTADIVIGQSDFISSRPNAGVAESDTTLSAPEGAATDSSGNLFVADSGNNRVLEFAAPAAACGPYPCVDSAPAIRVFGTCGSFEASACTPPGSVSASSLLGPSAVAFDRAGDLFISDSGNSRVLEFPPPFVAAPAAIRVFGQSGNFTTNQCNGGGLSTALTLCAPGAVAADIAGDLFIADMENNRALEFTAPFSAAPQASVVFGQNGSFTSSIANAGGASASTLDAPAAVALDPRGNLYIVDSGNSRVLEFAPPYPAAPAAIAVFGQSSMSAIGSNQGAAPDDLDGLGPDSLWAPGALALDSADNLYVADSGNNRVLMYPDPPSSPTPTVTATPTFTPTPSATLSATPIATATVSPTPTATASPTDTATTTPTATPTAVAERITIKPLRVNFGKVKLGVARVRQVKVINKKSKHSVAVIIESVDPAPAPFTVANQCPRVLAAGANCSIDVTFAPQSAGRVEASIAISDNAEGSPRSVELSGIGK